MVKNFAKFTNKTEQTTVQRNSKNSEMNTHTHTQSQSAENQSQRKKSSTHTKKKYF